MKDPKPTKDLKGLPAAGGVIGIWYAIISISLFFYIIFGGLDQTIRVPYSTFLSAAQSGTVDNLVIGEREITGKFVKGNNAGKAFSTAKVDAALADKLTMEKVTFEAARDDSLWKSIAGWIIPIALLIVFWTASARMGQGMPGGAGMMAIEKSGAKIYEEDKVKITFADVAGVDEAKEELKEVIGFLKQPERYWRLGGHLPKGILLIGPPGTGKTLLARAVAGEAGVPFFSISGSQFVELFVGVGAARVRDLFAKANEKAPCIIFIDELDALGKARSMNPVTGSHDEKEQTLNQLLVELDGFDPMQGVILIAATNRPEMLDTALLRAGRFDRQIMVDRPDKTGRAQILRVHLRNVTIDPLVDVDGIAAATPGFTGADLANLVNEAVLLAVRRDAERVQEVDLNAAIERIVAGLEKKSRLLNTKERNVVAHHEAGHALVSLLLPGTDVVQKVSIIPRGIGALGYTIQRPTEDRFLMSKSELENKMTVLLGGRAAEMLVFKETSTGAADDLVKATDIARSMVTRYGMSPILGPITYESESRMLETWQPAHFSDETAKEIDGAVRQLVEDAFNRASTILDRHYPTLIKAALKLLESETISGADLAAILTSEGSNLLADESTQQKRHVRTIAE